MIQNNIMHNIPGVFIAFAEIIFQFELKQKNVWQQIKWQLVHAANNKYPDVTIKNLSNLIGVDRNTFSDLLKELPPEPKSNNLAVLLTVLKSKAEDDVIELKAFMTIAKKIMKSSLSPENALNELIKKETVELVSGNKIKIKSEGLYTTGLSD